MIILFHGCYVEKKIILMYVWAQNLFYLPYHDKIYLQRIYFRNYVGYLRLSSSSVHPEVLHI